MVTLTTVFSDESGVQVTGDTGLGVKRFRFLVSLFFFIVVHVVGNLHFLRDQPDVFNGYVLFLCSFVLYTPWIPGEHCRGIRAVECVTAHLRGFEVDSRSEVVFWTDAWSIEFGYHWLMLLVFLTAHLFQFHFADT